MMTDHLWKEPDQREQKCPRCRCTAHPDDFVDGICAWCLDQDEAEDCRELITPTTKAETLLFWCGTERFFEHYKTLVI